MKKILAYSAVGLGLFALAFLLGEHAVAQNLTDQVNNQINAGASRAGFGTARPPQEIIASIIQIMLSLVGTFFLGLTLYSGYMLFTARGDEEKVTKSKATLRSAVIGLFIVLTAYGITIFVSRIVFTATAGDPSVPAEGSGINVRCEGLDCELQGR